MSTATTKTSKELDDLVQNLDGYERMANRDVEVILYRYIRPLL